MKTRTTRLTLSHFEGVFEVEIIDEGAGEYVLVSCGLDRPPFEQSISIGPSEWPFLRDAIDRMFVEIAKNEGEGKQALPDAEAPPREQSSPIGAASGEASWIPWDGGECSPTRVEFEPVLVCLRDGTVPTKVQDGWKWDWTHYGGENDIIAYKVVD
jgi:hypothetical protein